MNPNLNPAPRVTAGLLRATGILLTLGLVAPALRAQPVSSANPPPAAVVDKPLLPPTNDVPNPQPSPQDVWIPGHWHWGQGSYVWVAGDWQVPPAPNATWIAPQWQPVGSGYVLHEAFWQQNAATPPVAQPMPPQQTVVQPAPQTVVIAQPAPAAVPQSVIIVAQPPPAPPAQVEVRYGRHSRYDVWVPGYWAWTGGRYVWVSGHWARPPHGRRYWEEPRWEHRGSNWVFIEGHWR